MPITITITRPYPSEANFILCEVLAPWTGSQLRDDLRRQYGVMVRHYDKPELNGYVRISVGKPEHTDALMKAMYEIAEKTTGG